VNSHKNARLTFEGRKLLIERIAAMGLMPAAQAAGISTGCARKWLRRFEQAGRPFAKTCQALGIKHTFTRPYRPQTNGKAERFIQTCLREWAYGRSWAHSNERTSWLPSFLAYYNARRPHSALGYKPPASRLGQANLLQLNS
jgi:transposase InsO family protein